MKSAREKTVSVVATVIICFLMFFAAGLPAYEMLSGLATVLTSPQVTGAK